MLIFRGPQISFLYCSFEFSMHWQLGFEKSEKLQAFSIKPGFFPTLDGIDEFLLENKLLFIVVN